MRDETAADAAPVEEKAEVAAEETAVEVLPVTDPVTDPVADEPAAPASDEPVTVTDADVTGVAEVKVDEPEVFTYECSLPHFQPHLVQATNEYAALEEYKKLIKIERSDMTFIATKVEPEAAPAE